MFLPVVASQIALHETMPDNLQEQARKVLSQYDYLELGQRLNFDGRSISVSLSEPNNWLHDQIRSVNPDASIQSLVSIHRATGTSVDRPVFYGKCLRFEVVVVPEGTTQRAGTIALESYMAEGYWTDDLKDYDVLDLVETDDTGQYIIADSYIGALGSATQPANGQVMSYGFGCIHSDAPLEAEAMKITFSSVVRNL